MSRNPYPLDRFLFFMQPAGSDARFGTCTREREDNACVCVCIRYRTQFLASLQSVSRCFTAALETCMLRILFAYTTFVYILLYIYLMFINVHMYLIGQAKKEAHASKGGKKHER